jgi:sugar phosphate isomerase/epimerase
VIGLSTTYYATQGFSVYESVSKIVELGFKAVEFGPAHIYEENIWKILRKTKEDFKDISFSVHTLFPPFKDKAWFNPADGLNKINREIIDRLFRAAAVMESDIISIHPPVLNEITLGGKIIGNFNKPLIGNTKDEHESKKRFMGLMEYVNRLAEENKTKVIIENLNTLFLDTFLSTRDSFMEIFNTFPNIGMLLDVGHALECGSLEELIDLNGKIFELHLHDVGNSTDIGKRSHFPVKRMSYFKPIENVLRGDSILIVFEHGSDVSEEEIIEERELLETFLIT